MKRLLIALVLMYATTAACTTLDAGVTVNKPDPTPIVIREPYVVTVEKPVSVESDWRGEGRWFGIATAAYLFIAAIAVLVIVHVSYARRSDAQPQATREIIREITTNNTIIVVPPGEAPHVIRQIVSAQLHVTPLQARRMIESGAVQVKQLPSAEER